MPEDEDVFEDADDEQIDVMSRPRTHTFFDDEDEDEAIDTTGAELEEEYVCFSKASSNHFLILFLRR